MESFVSFRPGMELGYGFDTLSGEVRGFAVDGAEIQSQIRGQQVRADTRVVESQEKLLESLNISIEAEGRYGLFSAEGRFGLVDTSAYTSQSTFVVARCVVENAFRQVGRPKLQSEAVTRMRADGPEAFRRSYGDAWLRGMRTGGELYAVFQLTSTSQDSQRKIAVSLSAQLQGLMAAGSGETGVAAVTEASQKLASMTVTFFQRSGVGDEISPVTSPEDIERRLKQFPGVAHGNPAGYRAQIVDYEVLSMPQFDETTHLHRIEALEDYARLKLSLLSTRADIELARRNPQLFIDPPDGAELTKAWDAYTVAVNSLNRHARNVANRKVEPDLFVLGDLPLMVFVKRAPDADRVQIPDLRTMQVEQAKLLLRSLGLNAQGNGQAVTSQPGTTLLTVTTQTPTPGTLVAPGTKVVIGYNYVPDQRFPWFIKDSVRVADAVRRGGARSVIPPKGLGR